jgi:DNA-directed RNA polymerase specialized sigma24 family protein
VVLRRCFRARRRWPETVPLAEAPEPSAAAAPGAGLDVARLLAALAPRKRAVMHLTAVEGMSDGEIGAVLEITPAARPGGAVPPPRERSAGGIVQT